MFSISEPDLFRQQQVSLLPKMRGQTSRMVHHPVTGIVAVTIRLTQHLSHQPGIVAAADEPGDLAVGGHFPRGISSTTERIW